MNEIGRLGRAVLIGFPYAWFGLFFLLPLLIVLKIALGRSADAIPPYISPLSWSHGGLAFDPTLANFRDILCGGCMRAYGASLGTAALATVLCLLAGYPIAYAIWRSPPLWRNLLLFLVMLPFWTSFLIRVYAWMAILQPSGLLNRVLLAAGLIEAPVPLLYNGFSLQLGLLYSYLPFMILPIYGSLSQLDEALLEAAADLGARPWRVLAEVVVPLSLPGIGAGALLVFVPAVGEFVIPDLLAGPGNLMIGKLLWAQFFENRDWPEAAAIAVLMVAGLAVPILVAQRVIGRERPA
ncbi:MAG: ABC transporter permease subunit [Alphaproteobacteria bacterium]|nr:ABC transporter permease subunit [Alphaproteobacteria bacterium]